MQGLGKALGVSLLLIVSALVPSSGVLAMSDDGMGAIGIPEVRYEGYHVSILDAYAVTEIERVLHNPSSEPMAYSFVFRIPEGALISNFSIEVESSVYYADVLESDEAEQKYQEAVAAGTNAALVAYRDDQYFDYKVSLAPGEVLTATIRYEEVLLKENGWHTYRLPIGEGLATLPVESFEVNVSIQSPTPIEELEVEGYEGLATTSWCGMADVTVALEDGDLVPSEDLLVRWRTGGGAPEGMMYFGEHDGQGYFLHVFDPDPSHLGEGRVPKDFVFVLDKSGSMRGTKFSQSLKALRYIYGSLQPDDRFCFVWFDSFSNNWAPLRNASTEEIDRVLDLLGNMSASGTTNIHAGVVDALSIIGEGGSDVPVIVLLTDGRANSGLYHRSSFRSDVRERNTVGASIYSIALGEDADWSFIEALALENNGRAIWVDEQEDVVTRITDFVRTFSSPLLANITFTYGDQVTEVHPATIPAHFEGSEVLVAGKFPLGLHEIPMQLDARSADGDRVTQATFPVDACPSHEFVPRFWAFQRIKDLEDSMKYNGTDKGTIDEIVRLALEFHFATDHTSLFVELPEEIQERFYPDLSPDPSPDTGDIDSDIERDSLNDPAPTDPAPAAPSTGFDDEDGDGCVDIIGDPAPAAPSTGSDDASQDSTTDSLAYSHSVDITGEWKGTRDGSGEGTFGNDGCGPLEAADPGDRAGGPTDLGPPAATEADSVSRPSFPFGWIVMTVVMLLGAVSAVALLARYTRRL